ncbi:MAG: phosphoenolpyruvate--protein phosphotransferase [Acidimicrobiia bacterium]|nr:phosphoenolpyruvate--protein phosphotransferase [Acidimicrobiia bacterium]
MTDMTVLQGSAASPGIGEGPAFVLRVEEPELPELEEPHAAFLAAADTATNQLTELATAAESAGLAEAGEILRAQAMMAEDPMLADEVKSRLAAGAGIGEALDGAVAQIAEALRNSGSEYLAERAADVGEIAKRIRFAIAGVVPAGLSDITDPAVVIARALTAADTAAMNPELVTGFVTEEGGPTGHVAVIARALGIPAAVAVDGATSAVETGEHVIVDGGAGTSIIRPDDETVEEYVAKAAAHRKKMEAAEQYRGKAIGFGDRKMSIAANVGSPDDIGIATAAGADGVGLFRTEFLFLDADEPPSEDKQVEVYREAVESFDAPVVIRTFDIGGDKPAPYLNLPEEENPFLGVRGMRLYEAEWDLALSQARSLLRAATAGELWVMAPMVADVTDAAKMKELFDEAAKALDAEGLEHGSVKLGVMVEVPSAALNAAALANHVDFFSIGTNDLTQYTVAVDRTSAPLARYLDAAEPAVLKLCAETARAGAAAGVSVSVCGEAASDPGLALLFAAMGMDKLSVNAPAVNLIKQTVAEADPAAIVPVLKKCLAAESAGDVRQLLAGLQGD